MTPSPTTLTPHHTDAEIVASLAATGGRWTPPLIRTREHDGQTQVWSKTRREWVSVADYAAEWRHGFRFRQIVGSEDECRALNNYERAMGL